MAGLITQRFHDRSQEMSDQLRNLAGSGAGAGVGGTTLRWRTTTGPQTRTGLAYGNIPAMSGGQAGLGEVILDHLNIDNRQFEDADSQNPQTVYNLTTVEIPDGSRLILWRDPSAKDGDGTRTAWYVGGTAGGDTVLAMPTAVLSLLNSPYTIFEGVAGDDLFFEATKTNDPSTFGFIFDANENVVNGVYNGIKLKREGDYIIRWGYNAEIAGIQVMSEGDNPAQGLEDNYIIDHFETAEFKLDVKGYRLGPLTEVFSSDSHSGGTNRGTLFYFVNFAESKHFAGYEAESFQADRVVRLRFQLLNAYNGINITRPFLEITRIGPATDAVPH